MKALNRNHQTTRKIAAALAAGLMLASVSVSHAMSGFSSIAIEPQWPTTNDPGPVVLYTVTVYRVGEGDIDVTLSAAGLPDGATASFSLNPVRFTGRVPTSLTTTLAITCTNIMATDPIPFTVTGDDSNLTILTVTNMGYLTFDAALAANPMSRPRLAIDHLGNKNMKIRGKGATGIFYQIQASPSLPAASWAPLGITRADGNGRFTYLDLDSSKPANFFYRASGPASKK